MEKLDNRDDYQKDSCDNINPKCTCTTILFRLTKIDIAQHIHHDGNGFCNHTQNNEITSILSLTVIISLDHPNASQIEKINKDDAL